MSIGKLLTENLILENGESWRLGAESLHYIYDNVLSGQNTIETGIGYSTFLFAHLNAKHRVCYVSEEAQRNVVKYASQYDIDLSTVEFIPGKSQYTLPNIKAVIDFALIDGDHAFPMPIIDFYYIGMITKIGGCILLDDMTIRSVHDVFEFVKNSKHWRPLRTYDDGRSLLVQKISDPSTDWFGRQDYNTYQPDRISLPALL